MAVGIDKIHKSMVMELDSIQLEAGPGGFETGKLVFQSSNLGVIEVCSTNDVASRCIGIANETKNEGENGSVATTGTVINSSWNWTPGDRIWASPSTAGELTTVASGSHLFIGIAITAHKILLGIRTTDVQSTQNVLTFTAGPGLSEGVWVYFDTADSKVKPHIATELDDVLKLVGVVISTGTINDGDDVQVLNFGIWNSSSTIAGAVGDRWLSLTVAGEMQDTQPVITKRIWLGYKIAPSKMFVTTGRQGNSGTSHPQMAIDEIVSFTGGQPVLFSEGLTTDLIEEATPGNGVQINSKVVTPLVEATLVQSDSVETPEVISESLKMADGSRFNGKRQVILSGRRNKYNSDFIEVTSSSVAKATASPSNPLIVSIANGFADTGEAINYIEKITSDITYAIDNKAINFLGIKRETNGTLSPVVSHIEPLYGRLLTSDRENKVCATFDSPSAIGVQYFADAYNNMFQFFNGALISNDYSIFGSTTTAKFPGAAGDYAILTPNSFNISDLDEWTIEFDIKFNNLSTASLIFGTNKASDFGIRLYRNSSNALEFYLGTGNGWIISAASILAPGAVTFDSSSVYTIAITFDKNIIRVLVNGQLRYTSNAAVDYVNYVVPYFDSLIFGCEPDLTSNRLNAYIANFQIWPYVKYLSVSRTINAVIYTPSYSAAVPDTPTEYRHIQHQNVCYFDFETLFGSRFIDYYGKRLVGSYSGSDSVTQPGRTSFTSKFGTYSLLRSGSVYSANHAKVKMDLNTSAFTIAFWYSTQGLGTAHTVLYGDVDYSVSIGFNASNQIIIYLGNGSSWSIASGTTGPTAITANTWVHIALTFDGQYYRIFLDGVSQAIIASISRVARVSGLCFGHPFSNANNPNNSFYDDFVVLPSCIYTTGFTPPVAAYTPEAMYYYDTERALMYKGQYGSFTNEPTIFVGEVEVPNTFTILPPVSYAINGKTEFEIYGMVDESGPYTTVFRHNIGVKDIAVKTSFIFGRNLSGFFAGEEVLDLDVYNSYYTTGAHNTIIDRNRFSHTLGAERSYLVIRKSDGAALGIRADRAADNITNRVRFLVERKW